MTSAALNATYDGKRRWKTVARLFNGLAHALCVMAAAAAHHQRADEAR